MGKHALFKVTCDPCTFYWSCGLNRLAAALVMGDLGSTVWSCVMAIQTFCSIALGKHWPRWVVWTIVFFGWLFVILLSRFYLKIFGYFNRPLSFCRTLGHSNR